MDNLTSEKRSALMKKVRRSDTKPELIVRKFLFSRGFRYRINDKRYPGSPDIVLPKYHTVVFVHGCFWHGHEGCTAFRIPKTNTAFWNEKITRNVERDRLKIRILEKEDWTVIVIWECSIKMLSTRKEVLENLVNKIKNK